MIKSIHAFVLTLLSFFILFLFFLSFPLQSQIDPASDWNLLYPKIRDRLISKGEAHAKMKELEPILKNLYLKNSDRKSDNRLCFPLVGYHSNAIGGKKGSGYQIQGYDFFDGNQHKGHPGHDFFIQDKNQDGLDDMTGKPAELISASSGIVVSVHPNWELSSLLRGGNYVWIYEPIGGRYVYYAHLNEIFVRVGQIILKGEPLGTLGRTGVNAYSKRSPTHLHFTIHQSTDGYPKPINPYMELIRSTPSQKRRPRD
jgi:murein DD-endopeptidase MepM/ murein hydrolase activator NlpD